MNSVLRTKWKLGEESTKIHQQGELANRQEAEDYLCDHDLVVLKVAVFLKVKITLNL